MGAYGDDDGVAGKEDDDVTTTMTSMVATMKA
jgi:hypothetical protein